MNSSASTRRGEKDKEDLRMLALCKKSRPMTYEEVKENKAGRSKWIWEVVQHNRECQKRINRRNKNEHQRQVRQAN